MYQGAITSVGTAGGETSSFAIMIGLQQGSRIMSVSLRFSYEGS